MNRILIIEDEETIAFLERDYLELSGFEVEIENGGEKGLERSLTEPFDLIILDLMLPEVDGFEICRQVREKKNIPIIMVSAKKDDIDKIRGHRAIRGLRIDKTARRVWVDGQEKPFTTKEFDLLTFLAQNPNHVFTKDDLFREIWDMESIGDIATVTVHIKKIREKIEKQTSKPQYIETIWGVGYRFKI